MPRPTLHTSPSANGSRRRASLRVPTQRSFSAGRYLVVSVLYIVLRVLVEQGSVWYSIDGGYSLWFPPAGLDVALLFIFGWRYLPALAVAQALSLYALVPLAPLPSVLYIAAHVGVYGGTAVFLLHRVGIDPRLRRLRDATYFVFGMALGAPFLLGLLKVTLLELTGVFEWSQFVAQVVTIWTGDATGIAMVAPPLLIGLRRIPDLWWDQPPRTPPGIRGPYDLYETLEMLAQGTLILLCTWLVYRAPHNLELDYSYLLFIPVLWIAARFGTAGAAVGVFTLNIAAALFIAPTADQFDTYAIQFNLMTISLSGILLGAYVNERWRDTLRAAQARWRAESADRLKDSILMNMSHEIRTPLTTVLGYADLAATHAGDEAPATDGDDEQHFFIRQIQKGALRLTDMLTALLNMAEMQANRKPFTVERVNLAQLARTVGDHAQTAALQKNLRLQLPASTHATYAFADVPALRQVISHLLDNAIKYTETGSVVVEVYEHHGEACLSVSDTGMGIEASDLDRIFEPFYQHSMGKGRTHEGVGLGLAIAAHLVETMEGRIDVYSTPGQGSTFEVWLPQTKPGDLVHLTSHRASTFMARRALNP